jgi:RNA-directed DNA polymerase
MTAEHRPSAVAVTPTQDGDIRARWGWVEPTVWTDRMLTALETGVKGGQWFSLIDKMWSEKALDAAWERVRANAGSSGVDGQTVHRFAARAAEHVRRLNAELRADRYRPLAVRRRWLPKPGRREKRPLGIPTVRDRVVQTALRAVLEPIFDRLFAAGSYGFRPGRGCKDALRAVARLLKAGYTWVVDADLQSYFDTIPHERLMALVAEQVADGRLLALLRQYLQGKVMDGMEEWTPEQGTPQGAVISPLLANIYLNPLDHHMAGQGWQMIRYADDFVILCRSREEAERALQTVRDWVTAAGLSLHPAKTRIVHEATEAFEFLGYRFERGRRWPRRKSLDKFKHTIRHHTRRCNGHSLPDIIRRVNATARGWYGYFKHSGKNTFPELDGWIRRRLRAILLKRHGESRWRHTPLDRQRWPNSFLRAQGLFSLAAAHAAECQPRSR